MSRATCCLTAGLPETTKWDVPRDFGVDLAVRNERYLLAVPSNTTIRDLCGAVPEGKRVRPFEQVRAWAAALPEEAWTRIDVRDAHHGPLVAEVATTRVVAKTDRKRIGPEEVLVVMRVKEASGTMEVRLSPVECRGGYTDRRVRARHQSRAPHRGVHSTRQERGRIGRLRGAFLGRLAPPSNPLAHRHMVPGARSQAGKKNRHLP